MDKHFCLVLLIKQNINKLITINMLNISILVMDLLGEGKYLFFLLNRGHDLHICNNCNTVGSSYSNLGYTYEGPNGKAYGNAEC